MEPLVILIVLVCVAAAMAVVWLLLEATESFGVLAAPPRSDKPFSLSVGPAPPPAGSMSPPSAGSMPPAPPPSFPVSAVRPLTEPGRLTQLTVTSPAQASATPGHQAPAQPWVPTSGGELPAHRRWSPGPIEDGPIGHRPGLGRDLGVGAAARRTAFIVGSRAREAILGYGFANPDAATGGPPRAGEEPAPGHTVVLVDDDVEAWVRERLYGDRLPSR